MVSLTLWDLGIGTVCMISLFFIIFLINHSLLRTTSATASAIMKSGRPSIRITEYNIENFSKQQLCRGEGMMTRGWRLVI